jgi:hypothetical protein
MTDRENPARLNELSASEKMILALKGDSEIRMKLVQDSNRTVWGAALCSPNMNEQDAELISAMREVQPDVLREIAKQREWTKRYKVCLNLVTNPVTPEDIALTLLPRLSQEDLERVTGNSDLSSRIRSTAERMRGAP